ncbi:MTA/SAH nucleosidase / phosphatase [Paenibacillus mucilaginosus 3016]|uniref:MTA/SAH nucleosidase / phosphatase n=1 Tax=Paenibacillus mucilaginosus 3016 TaxID=1116391 RepID=H6NFP9_9BACL|nr:HAD family hydrolase [Paenibacillus mucilaginosus]AFC30689.1 MTA/SAH nucleosidase / phosphatase [Paenibacillus mucilaginosus 3016]WFA19299.1 HAD family hydrolase [Paenibacillus mucilaginosus]
MTDSIIFDMDGTLFRTDTILEHALEETFDYLRDLKAWSAETPLQAYRAIMGVPLPVVWDTLMPEHTDQMKHEANAFFQKQLIQNIRSGKGQLYPGVTELLTYLKSKGFTIYIASNGEIEYLQAIVEHYSLDSWVTKTFSIQHIQSQSKTDLVAHIIRTYDIRRAAVVGDRLSDILAAKKNGLLSIGCRFDFAQEEELRQADVIVNHLVEVQDYIH